MGASSGKGVTAGVDGLGDLELFDEWLKGDLRAGNALFERHFDSIYRFFAHKAPTDATDLVQRTFLACVEAKARFRQASSFRTFLFAIARHELLAHFRRRRPDALDASVSSVADFGDSPITAMARRSEHRVLLEALRTLPLDLQVALELHYWEQLSATEIGEVLGVPAGTAKSRLRRARALLTESISKLEEDPVRLKTTLANLDVWAAALKHALVERQSLVDEPSERE